MLQPTLVRALTATANSRNGDSLVGDTFAQRYYYILPAANATLKTKSADSDDIISDTWSFTLLQFLLISPGLPDCRFPIFTIPSTNAVKKASSSTLNLNTTSLVSSLPENSV
ncbi:uncharacterized protein A4U43_C03F10210 [Asparagus officinalis]|uniref:Uncharacterized protein n=1 Tax=Asparagus officinalis TaxID=4686 RepID=A0A5P1F9L9_ASPOF|nr:uncharacterized protein A4U43_C03F10210 [Asparagus officinalis]